MKILVTGSGGLLGSAIKATATNLDIVYLDREHPGGDLADRDACLALLKNFRPEVIVHCAAKVGGIALNRACQEQMFYANLCINSHLVHLAGVLGVRKFIAFGSPCAHGEDVLAGLPYESNWGYGWSKRALYAQLVAARKEFGMRFSYITPPAMYGPNDHFGPEGHVIPALIAKCYRDLELVVWGTGVARREVAFAPDVARIVLDLIEDEREVIGLGSGIVVSVRDIVTEITRAMDYKGAVVWDDTKPDGELERPLLPRHDFPWTDFRSGIETTCSTFRNQPHQHKDI